MPSRAVPITVGAVGDNVRADNAADQGSLGVLALGALVFLIQLFAVEVPDHGIAVLAVAQIDVVRNGLERPAVDLGAQLQLADGLQKGVSEMSTTDNKQCELTRPSVRSLMTLLEQPLMACMSTQTVRSGLAVGRGPL